MTDSDSSLGLTLHTALVAVRERASSPANEAALVRAVGALSRRLRPQWLNIDPADLEEVTADVCLTLLTRPSYEGTHPGQAVTFVTRLMTWRLTDCARSQSERREAPSGDDDRTDASHGTVLPDPTSERDLRWQLNRLTRTILLLAGETLKYRRVRAFLDHRLGVTEETRPSDRAAADRLAQARSVGRRYVRDLVAANPGSFTEDDEPLLATLLGEAPSSDEPDERPSQEDE